MRELTSFFVLLLLLDCPTTGSSQYYFSPGNGASIHSKKGQVLLAADLTVKPNFAGGELAGSYAWAKHFFLRSGMFGLAGGQEGEHIFFQNYELSNGLFFNKATLDFNSKKPMLYCFELQVGAGLGRAKNRFGDPNPSDDGTVITAFRKVFLQGTFGVRYRRFQGGFSLRANRVHFYRGEFLGQSSLSSFLKLRDSRTFWAYDPNFFARFGSKKVQFQVAYSISYLSSFLLEAPTFNLGVVTHLPFK